MLTIKVDSWEERDSNWRRRCLLVLSALALAVCVGSAAVAQSCPPEREETGATVLSFSPVTEVDGDVEFIHHTPPASDRILLFFHGGGGNAGSWFDKAERVRFIQAAVDAGYAVAALDSDDRTIKKWSTILDETNPDLINLQDRLAELEVSGLLGPDALVFGLGMSNGGGFVSRLSQLMALDAMAISHASGIAGVFTMGIPPATIFVAGRNDSTVPVSNFDANLATMDSLGVRHKFHVNEPRPVAAASFTRIVGVDASLSSMIHANLAGAALLDACGLQIADPASSGWEATLPSGAASFVSDIRNQLKELYGEHTFTSDFSSEILDFFSLRSGRLPARVHIVKPIKLAKLVSKASSMAPDTFALPTVGGAADPTLNGATLVVADLGQAAGSVSLELHSSGWSGLGNPPGSKGFRYKGKDDTNDPAGTCRVVLIKEKVIKAVCKGSAIALTPPYAGSSMVNLRIPGGSSIPVEYCWELGGDETKNTGVIMKRKNAPAPAACVDPGS